MNVNKITLLYKPKWSIFNFITAEHIPVLSVFFSGVLVIFTERNYTIF